MYPPPYVIYIFFNWHILLLLSQIFQLKSPKNKSTALTQYLTQPKYLIISSYSNSPVFPKFHKNFSFSFLKKSNQDLAFAGHVLKFRVFCPGCCGSVDWSLACEPKGHWFDSQTGHVPGPCGPGPQWGMRERQPHIDVSLSLLLPSFPSVQK